MFIDGLLLLRKPWKSFSPRLFDIHALTVDVLLAQVMVALLVGIFMGATLLNSCNVGTGLLRTFDTYWVGAMADKEHASILLFTFFIAGLIAGEGSGAQS